MPQENQHTLPGVLAFGLRDDAGSIGSGRAANGQEPMMVDAAARKTKNPPDIAIGGRCVSAIIPAQAGDIRVFAREL